jgi:hypothetical protein
MMKIKLIMKVKTDKGIARSLMEAISNEIRKEKKIEIVQEDDCLTFLGYNLNSVECRRVVRNYLTLLKTAEESIRAVS